MAVCFNRNCSPPMLPLSRGIICRAFSFLRAVEIHYSCKHVRGPIRKLYISKEPFYNVLSELKRNTIRTARVSCVSRECVRSMATGSDAPAVKKHQNRLAKEKSPYLLQHASNPVDWYPWGKEAFERSRKENKPIFLSVGYSTCHWCHVMERESFEDENIGKILSNHFIAIKVDREERPDVDKVYMTFIQASQGGGGWPMSVFLTPELEPFTGGTYFPPEDSFGHPGFATVLKSIAKQWETDCQNIRQKGGRVMEALRKMVSVSPGEEGEGPPGSSCIQRAYQMLSSREDKEHGGFGTAPKFPQPVILGFLLKFYSRYIGSDMGRSALTMVLNTLKAMSNGGIHDHVGQGFHRYSTDKLWHVPHFEKMLYDQAQLACVSLDAYQITKEEVFAEMSRDILLYISRDLSDEDGGFYAGEDADSLPLSSSEHKREGAFCVWSESEISSILSSSPLPSPSQPSSSTTPPPLTSSLTLADLFSHHYGVKPGGNVPSHKDPHGELTGQNVLIVRRSVEDTAQHFNLSVPITTELLSQAREKLAQVRMGRPKPQRDNKVVTSWNGLTISSFARGYQVLGERDYLKRAVRAAEFIHNNLFNVKSGKLLRNSYRETNGVMSVGRQEGFADDYSFLVQGLIDLFEASQDQKWLEWAWSLQEKQNELFWDEDGGGGYYSSTADDTSILLRVKDDQDGSEPTPNSVSASNLHRLSSYMNRKLTPSSAHVYAIFREMLTKAPVALCGMLESFVWHTQTPKQIIIAGDKDKDDTKSLLRVVHSFYLPNRVLVVTSPGAPPTFLSQHLPSLASMVAVGGKATAYVCENFTCSAPTSDAESLRKLLDPARHLRV